MSKSLDGVLIKKAYSQETYTEEQIEDLLKCTDPAVGYLYFIENFVNIQHPVKGKINFLLYEYQKRLLQSYHDYRFSVNICPRQSGKCFLNQTLIRIKHKQTGEEHEISVGDFFNMQKRNQEQQQI